MDVYYIEILMPSLVLIITPKLSTSLYSDHYLWTEKEWICLLGYGWAMLFINWPVLYYFINIYIFSIFRYQIPENWPYQEARRLFKEPAALTDEEQLEIKWTAPDEEVRNPSWKLLYDNPFNWD